MKIFIFGATFEFPRESDIVCVNRGVSSINGGAINSPSTSCITDPIRKIFFSPPMEPLDNNGNNTIMQWWMWKFKMLLIIQWYSV